jgi:hypothetical protein
MTYANFENEEDGFIPNPKLHRFHPDYESTIPGHEKTSRDIFRLYAGKLRNTADMMRILGTSTTTMHRKMKFCRDNKLPLTRIMVSKKGANYYLKNEFEAWWGSLK